MAAIGNVRWALVEEDGGRSWDVRSQRQDGTPAALSFGRVTFSDRGWVAHGRNGEAYGPFTTLDEAAYPLALRGSGEEADADLLLVTVPKVLTARDRPARGRGAAGRSARRR